MLTFQLNDLHEEITSATYNCEGDETSILFTVCINFPSYSGYVIFWCVFFTTWHIFHVQYNFLITNTMYRELVILVWVSGPLIQMKYWSEIFHSTCHQVYQCSFVTFLFHEYVVCLHYSIYIQFTFFLLFLYIYFAFLLLLCQEFKMILATV